MAVCDSCHREMTQADSCDASARALSHPIIILGRTYDPVPYNGRDARRGQRGKRLPPDRCHDCGVKPGGIHHPNCDMESCPACGGQWISCGPPFFDGCNEDCLLRAPEALASTTLRFDVPLARQLAAWVLRKAYVTNRPGLGRLAEKCGAPGAAYEYYVAEAIVRAWRWHGGLHGAEHRDHSIIHLVGSALVTIYGPDTDAFRALASGMPGSWTREECAAAAITELVAESLGVAQP